MAKRPELCAKTGESGAFYAFPPRMISAPSPFFRPGPWLAVFLMAFAAPAAVVADTPAPNYTYYAELVRVVDANTVALNIDLGFGVWLHNQNVDLKGLPEPVPMDKETPVQKTERLAQTSRLRDVLKDRKDLTLQSFRDKTATPPRYLGVLWADDVNLNDALLK